MNWVVNIANIEIKGDFWIEMIKRRVIMNYVKRILAYTLVNLFSLIIVSTPGTAQQESDVVFRDDFVGTSLNPRWQLIAPDEDRWTFVDGDYLLIVSSKAGKNVMQFNGELPDDYEITVKAQTPPQHDDQVIRLILKKDNENNIRVGYHSGSEYRVSSTEVFFIKTLRGENSRIDKVVKKLSKNEQLYLKLSKRGVEYTGAYSTDGSTWIEIGTHIFLNLDGKPAFETYNLPNGEKPPESGIRFDYFEIRQLK